MNAETHSSQQSPENLNLRRLVGLRFIAIAAGLVAVLVTLLHFDMALPLIPILVVVLLLASFNVYTWMRLRSGTEVTRRSFFAQILVDVGALTALLFLTGGASNPFALFFLLPLTIAAMTLPRSHTWAMAVVTALCYTLLLFGSMPSVQRVQHADHDLFGLHVFGMWLGFVLIAGLIAHFVVGMGEALRSQARRLALAREKSLRDERVVALGTLAAGAAHELGTPLSTMAVVINELAQEPAQGPEVHRQLAILRDQIDRCKEALAVISASAGAGRAEAARPMDLDAYLTEILDRLRRERPGVDIAINIDSAHPAPRIVTEHTLTQALMNILNNAADAAPENIKITASWDQEQICVDVEDQGVGMHLDPTQPMSGPVGTTKREGLGIGLFLSHTAVQRLGGSITLQNRDSGGMTTSVRLPLSTLTTSTVS